MNFKTIFVATILLFLVGGLVIYGLSWNRKDQNNTAKTKALEIRSEPKSEKKRDSTTPTKAKKVKPKVSSKPIEKVIQSEPNSKSMDSVDSMKSHTTKTTMVAKNEKPTPTPTMKTKASLLKKETSPMATTKNDVFDGKTIAKSKSVWRKDLSPMQFYVLREKGTEQPYSGKYTDNKHSGEYHCAACGLKLFSSKSKYNSNTGWASFFKPFAAVNILEETDTSLEETRTEVLCARCNSHLGHVFDDGPKPTGLRYCINSAALDFKKQK